jgi:hypothetical protein
VALADVQQHGVELCQLLAQHQSHLNSITSGEVSRQLLQLCWSA